MRAFIAIDLPTEFADDAAAVARVLSASVEGRFLPRGTYHLTLAFLGDITDAQASQAMDALDVACAEAGPVVLSPEGLGKFGRATDATLWLGIAKTSALENFTARLREGLAARDVPFDDKSFLPHITLARRVRIPKGHLSHLAFPLPAQATTATLYKSTLTREGSLYKPLYSVQLEGK